MEAHVCRNKHTANYLRLLTEVSCSPSAASPRDARNSPALLPVSASECLEKKRSGKIVRSHFDERHAVCARVCTHVRVASRRSEFFSVSAHSREREKPTARRPPRNRRRVLRTNGRAAARLGSARRGQARPRRGSLRPGRRAAAAANPERRPTYRPANRAPRRSRAAAIHPATARKRSLPYIAPGDVDILSTGTSRRNPAILRLDLRPICFLLTL